MIRSDLLTAFNRLWTLERACEIQLVCDAGRGPIRAISAELLANVPQARMAINRTIFDTMLRRAGTTTTAL